MGPRRSPVFASSRLGRVVLGLGLGLVACSGGGGAGDDVATDPDATVDPDGGGVIDAPPTPIDAAMANWATYRVEVGRHDATITGGGTDNPIRAFTMVDGRDFQFAFNPSAMYVLTMPVDPTDQLDWNKLPGLSDCNTVDLSVNGAMFGWRWRLDLVPNVLEVTAYANNNRTHLWPNQPLFTLTAAELAADVSLRYRVWWTGATYHFAVTGMVGDRVINAATTITRVCPNQAAGALKWASGLYFGGTSTAPTVVTGRVLEIPFAP